MAEDFPNYEPLEAADDLCPALSFGRSPADISKRGLVRPHPDDGHAVQSSVGLPVSTPVQPMPAGLAAGSRHWTGTA